MHPFLTPASVVRLGETVLPFSGGSLGEGTLPLVAGVMSGTSADGIDVVLCRIEVDRRGVGDAPRVVGVELVAFATEPFPEGLAARVRGALDGESLDLGALCALDRDLGRAFGLAAREVCARHGLGELVLVASHGQTVFHHDGDLALGKVTLQLGDGDHVAEAAGCPVVSDFRTRDCAAGGEGAPLVALVDDVLFRSSPRPLAILNLGGIANWTVLLGEDRAPLAFDTGPAGALLDGLSRRLLKKPFDLGGAVAMSGRARGDLAAGWLDHPFFLRSGPRSTGRDTFGESFVSQALESMEGSPPEDILATAVHFVARSAAQGLAVELSSAGLGESHGRQPLALMVAGGGWHNKALMKELRAELGRALGPLGQDVSDLESCSSAGVPPDAREALAFAVLGARMVLGEPSTSPGATGALAGRTLGKWSPGPSGPVGQT